MNDPIEAFYDHAVDWLKPFLPALLQELQDKVEEFPANLIDSLALISFSDTYQDLLIWAYYASHFSGLCLEFDTSELAIGDLQNEELRRVTYSRSALPPLTLASMDVVEVQEAEAAGGAPR